MPVAKLLKIDRVIRRNVYACHLFRTYVGRLGFMLPLAPEFRAFRVLPSTQPGAQGTSSLHALTSFRE
jgi:hypothetical protein